MSDPRRWLAAAVALALIALLFWLLRGASGKAEERESLVLRPAAVSRAEAQTEEASPDAMRRTAVPGEAPADDPTANLMRSGLQVLVLDEGQRPVAGATVTWLMLEQVWDLRSSSAILWGWARAHAPRATTDVCGIALLPLPAGLTWIGAEDEDRSEAGWLFPERMESPERIQLRQKIRQEVRVVDVDGRMVAEAAVGFLRGAEVAAEARTGADGVAVLDDLQLLRSTGIPQPAFVIALIGPFAEAPSITYSFESPPEEAPVLTLPASGEVEILLEDAGGRPLPGRRLVQLARDHPEHASSREVTRYLPDSQILATEDGRLLFPRVGIGLELQAALRTSNPNRPLIARFRGPEVSGQRVTAALREVADGPRIAARLLAPDGSPMPGARVLAEYRLEFASGDSWLTTDEVGCTLNSESRLAFEAWSEQEDRLHREKPRRIFRVRTPDPAGVGSWSAEIQPQIPLAPGLNDLGDLRLEPTPVVAAGRVLDESGQPIFQGTVSISRRNSNSVNPSNEWSMPRLRSFTTRSGSFRMEGRPPPGDYRITVSDQVHRTEFQALELGKQDYEFRLADVLQLSGVLHLDEEIPRDALLVHLHQAQNTTGRADMHRIARSEADGRWTMPAPADGIANFTIEESWSQRVLWRMDGIAFHGGQPSDPQILNLDLRGAFRMIALEVVDPDGAPVPEWLIDFRGVPNSDWRRVDSLAAVRLIHQDSPLDFGIRAPGFRGTSVRGAIGDQRIVLQRGIPVSVAIASHSPLPEDLEILVSLYDEETKEGALIVLDRQGKGVLLLSEPGEYSLEVSARNRQGNRGTTQSLRLDAATRARRSVAVPEEGLAEPLLIGLRPESLEEARRSLPK